MDTLVSLVPSLGMAALFIALLVTAFRATDRAGRREDGPPAHGRDEMAAPDVMQDRVAQPRDGANALKRTDDRNVAHAQNGAEAEDATRAVSHDEQAASEPEARDGHSRGSAAS